MVLKKIKKEPMNFNFKGNNVSIIKNDDVPYFIGKAVAFITKNRKPLKEIASSVWSIVKSISAGAWDTIKIVLNVLGESIA